MEITKEDFASFINSPVWKLYEKYLKRERGERDSLSDSHMMQLNAYSEGLSGLEALGLEAAMKMACVVTIDFALDMASFEDELFGGADES